MGKIHQGIKRGLLYVVALVVATGYPIAAMAETQEPVTETPPSTTTPVEAPTTPPPAEPELTYTYNPVTEKWDSEKWQYNPSTGTYETPPPPVIIQPTPQPEKKDTTETNSEKTVDTKVNINTDILSEAISGNSTVANNTSAGNATTGNAEAIATVINSVNSSLGASSNQKVATFTQDIMGDVKGDIVLYPLLLKAMLEAGAGGASTSVNATNDLQLNNTINLTAQSGDATVSGNTSAGNATTGSAQAVANVVNILNSMIAAQSSFIGTINIYGNLEGDILIAPDFIPQMLANNSEALGSTKVSQQDTTTIVNNISAVAESGAASVFNNTTAGSATTGDANSNVVIFNISGHEIVAKNSLLVFVNVLGTWVGVIVDAPANATAAMIGNEVTKNTAYAPDLTVNSQSSHGITNTIAVNAQSGDATVASNTSAGNAISGQAQAMANVANISGSQFGMSDWFGVLFINVFQSWYGSFGIDTAYGNEIDEEPEVQAPEPTGPIQFIPATQTVERSVVTPTIIDSRSNDRVEVLVQAETGSKGEAVLAQTKTDTPVKATPKTSTSTDVQPPQDYRLWIIAGSLFIIGLSALGIRRLLQ